MAGQAVWVADMHAPPEPRSASRARDFVAHQLRRHGLRYLVHDVQLVASELVTNSLEHARTPIHLTIQEDLFCVVLTVHDGSPSPPVLANPGPDDGNGRGLIIVGGNSYDWGVQPDPDGGKSVWVIFGLRPPTFSDWATDA